MKKLKTEITKCNRKGKYLVTIIGNMSFPKIFNDKGFELIKIEFIWISQMFQHTIQVILSCNWVLFHPEFTSVFGPWGYHFIQSYSSRNRLGNWTFEQFKIAMTQGKHEDGKRRHLLPNALDLFKYY